MLLLAAMTQTLFAFVGLEVATVPAGVVKDPDRTIPRATLVGTILTAAIYVISTAGAMSLVAPEVLMKSTAPLPTRASAGRQRAGNAGGGRRGDLSVWIAERLDSRREPVAARRREGRALSASVRARELDRMPVTGMVIAGVLSSLLIMFNYSGGSGLVVVFTKTLVLSTLATLIPYAFCSLAVFIPGGGRAKNLGAGATAIAIIAFIYSLFCIYGAGEETVFLGFLLIVIGLPVYVWVVRQRAGAARSQAR
jgi:APA family basic amino acid/polyamine antiporter